MKKVPVAVRTLVCQTCAEVSYLIDGGPLDAFIRFGCSHTVKNVLMDMLKEKIAARKKIKTARKRLGSAIDKVKKSTARKRGA